MATYSDKIQRIKKNLESRTILSNLVPGSKAYQFIEALSYELMQLEYKMEDYINSVSILTATGRSLDDIGERVIGVKRLEEVPPFVTSSMKAIKFYLSSGVFGDINKDIAGNPQDITVPEGTIISGNINGTLIKFRTTSTTTLAMNSSEQFIDAEIIQGSSATIPTGVLRTHNFKSYTQAINERLLVRNTVPIGSGREVESDESYRFRLVNAPKAIPKNTYAGIYEAAVTASGVSNAFIEAASNGGGTFTVYVQGITPITADEIIEDVRLKISDQVSPWVTFNVEKPNYIGLEMSFEIEIFGSIQNKETLMTKIKSEISDQVNNFYGTEFQINSLIRTVLSAHQNISKVEFSYVRIYTGAGDIRGYTEVDFNTTPDPIVFLTNKEKLIIEPQENSIMANIG